MEAFTLFELNEHIKRVIALNFEAPLWVSCEIAQVRESRGHYYFELVQKNDSTDEIIAQSSAALWSRQYWFLKKKMGVVLDDLLEDGVELKVKINVTFHERWGFKLVIEDFDTSYTMGQLELKRRGIIEKLQKEERLHTNGLLELPLAIQKVAVISSATAAGLQDFQQHLEENQYGYKIEFDLYESAMQGSNVEHQMLDRLKEIEKKGGYDAIVIIRGGGSRLDLSAFDNYTIAVAVSKATVPVLVGIGHDIDQSVLDLVSHSTLKTPTAVADFIVSYNADFETALNEKGHRLQMNIKYRLERAQTKLIRYQSDVKNIPSQKIGLQYSRLNNMQSFMKQSVSYKFDQQTAYLNSAAKIVRLVHPDQVLKKGYSYVMKAGKIISKIDSLQLGDVIETKFKDGQLKSSILEITK